MKYFIQTILLILFMTSLCTAQEMDMQWYVTNKKGLKGENFKQIGVPQSDDYDSRDSIWVNRLRASFIIGGISEPISINPPGVDAILAIYNDGTFYSSRYANIKSISGYIEGNSSGNWVSFRSEEASSPTLQALYFSNVYDKDDLPEKVNIEEGGNGRFLISPLDESDLNDESLLIAHSTVVPRKDITLTILNYKIEESNDRLILTYNQIVSESDWDFSNDKVKKHGQIKKVKDIFSESFVFQEKRWVFPESSEIREVAGQTEIYGTDENFIHVNLRALATLDKLAPLEVGEKAKFYALFELYENEVEESNRLARTVEPILPVRDPNRLVLRDVCIDCRSVYYTGQFFNTSENLATGLAVEIEIPETIDTATIRIDSSRTRINGRISIPETRFRDGILIMEWERNEGIRWSKNSYDSGDGKVQFGLCAKFINSIKKEKEMHDANLKPNTSTSFFFYRDSIPIATPLNYKDNTDSLKLVILGAEDDIGLVRYGKGKCSYCNSICEKNSWWKSTWAIAAISALLIAILFIILRIILYPKPKLPSPPSGY